MQGKDRAAVQLARGVCPQARNVVAIPARPGNTGNRQGADRDEVTSSEDSYMPDIAKVFREEIQRLAKRQVRAELDTVRRDSVRLKKIVADLRRQLVTLNRTSRQLVKKVTPAVAITETKEATEKAAKLRPTARSLKTLRVRLGLTQVQFGKLLGVSGQAVVHWASTEGRVRMRKTTLSALAGIQNIGKREAWRRLEEMGQSRSVRHSGRRK
jgi:DNA-binding transcriptional regulator YiaG